MYLLISAILFFQSFSFSESINDPELYKQFVQELTSPEGVDVEIHGADHTNGLYVISYRPQNFFDYVIISIQADYYSPHYLEVKKQLHELKRHDYINIKGDTNPTVSSHQSHILIKNLTVVTKFASALPQVDDYKHYTQLLKDVSEKTELIVKVHASLLEGKIFVVEYGDANIPIVVPNNELTKNLYRGDKIKIRFSVKDTPTAPVHFLLNTDPTAVEVMDSIVTQHQQPQDRCGELVMFPKSPQVKFNVFALKTDIGDNLFRTYTLINFENPDLFLALRDKAQAAWDAQTHTAIAGRNYYINPKIRVCAKGSGNMIVPTQANPQILIDAIDDLTFTFLP